MAVAALLTEADARIDAAVAQECGDGDPALAAAHYCRAVELVLLAMNEAPSASAKSRAWTCAELKPRLELYTERAALLLRIASDVGGTAKEDAAVPVVPHSEVSRAAPTARPLTPGDSDSAPLDASMDSADREASAAALAAAMAINVPTAPVREADEDVAPVVVFRRSPQSSFTAPPPDATPTMFADAAAADEERVAAASPGTPPAVEFDDLLANFASKPSTQNIAPDGDGDE
jgi:hypothetical protein